MAYASFREFVDALDKAGELKRIVEPVATELEITEIANREMKLPGGGKALLIEKPTVEGKVSPFPVAINTMGSWKRMAMSMGADSVDDVAAELGSLLKAKPPTSLRETVKLLGTALEMRHARPKRVNNGPCKEIIQKMEPADVRVENWPPAPDWKNPSTFGSAPYSARFAHSQMLAARWRTLHHASLRGHSGSGHRRTQCRDVSHSDL